MLPVAPPLHKIFAEIIDTQLTGGELGIITMVVAVQLTASVTVMVYDCALKPVKVPAGACVANGEIEYNKPPFPPTAEIITWPEFGNAHVVPVIIGGAITIGGGWVIFTIVLAVQPVASVTVSV